MNIQNRVYALNVLSVVIGNIRFMFTIACFFRVFFAVRIFLRLFESKIRKNIKTYKIAIFKC